MPSQSTWSIARKRSVGLLILGGAVFIVQVCLCLANPTMEGDFIEFYFPSRALLHHADPYDLHAVYREYLSQGPPCFDSVEDCTGALHLPYPPTGFVVTAAFGLLPYGQARILWTTLGAVALLVACFLVWEVVPDDAAKLAAGLIAFQLANSETVAWSANPGIIAAAFCTIAAWCFVRQRYVWPGAILFAVGLVLKPQVGSLVWLFLLLAKAPTRKPALRTFAVAGALALSSFLWVSTIAPRWAAELGQNYTLWMKRGGVDDFGPTSLSRPGWIVSLQTVVSLAWNDSRFYNSIVYLICGIMFAWLAWATSRMCKSSSRNSWLALAAVSAITLLVVYHRRYDCKLLILAVPACAMLRAEGGRIGRWALAITGSCFIFAGDGLWIFTTKLLDNLQSGQPTLFHFLQIVLIVLPAPLSILTMGVFYFWVFLHQTRAMATHGNNS
jgi:hypothetical protein